MVLTVHSDEYFMQQAYRQALRAQEEGEVPVGAVIVCKQQIIAKAYNQTEKLQDVTAHAEMLAITAAAHHLGAKYLTDCSLFVTLEPCFMCAGALFWSQVKRLVFGAHDPRKGYTTHEKKAGTSLLHPKTEVSSGLMAPESKLLLDDFFRELRN